MTLEAFGKSDPLTLGVELELQLVNTVDYDLTHYADNMLRLMAGHALPGDNALIGQTLVLRFGHAEAGDATVAVDERPVPEPVFIAGGADDRLRGRAEPVTRWDVADFGGDGAGGTQCQ